MFLCGKRKVESEKWKVEINLKFGIAVKTAKRTKVYVHAFQRVERGQGGEQPLVALRRARNSLNFSTTLAAISENLTAIKKRNSQ